MRKIISLISAITFILSGCSSSNKDDMATNTPSPTVTPTEIVSQPPATETVTDKPTVTPQIEYKTLIINENPDLYSYEDMETDLEVINQAYPSFTQLNVLGTTMDGRNIYDMVIGDINAPTHVIVHASIHAREYITTKLVMKQLYYYLNELDSSTGTFNGISYGELFKDTAVHVIPMVNPDGVTISQYGLEKIKKQETRDKILSIAGSDGVSPDSRYLTQWKSNANGVDLNRNFDALWSEYSGPSHPSSDHYKGTNPGSEPESAALITLTQKYNVARTISYHTFGQVIYWYFGQTGQLYDSTKKFADAMSAVTGYPTDANYEKLDPAGYKDWAIQKLSIPSITIEVGYGSNPVPNTQFEQIWNQNQYTWAAMLYDIKY